MSQSYTYHGPAQAVTLLDAAGAIAWEGTLAPGATVSDLPTDHPHVVAWIDGGLLKAEEPKKASGRNKTALEG